MSIDLCPFRPAKCQLQLPSESLLQNPELLYSFAVNTLLEIIYPTQYLDILISGWPSLGLSLPIIKYQNSLQIFSVPCDDKIRCCGKSFSFSHWVIKNLFDIPRFDHRNGFFVCMIVSLCQIEIEPFYWAVLCDVIPFQITLWSLKKRPNADTPKIMKPGGSRRRQLLDLWLWQWAVSPARTENVGCGLVHWKLDLPVLEFFIHGVCLPYSNESQKMPDRPVGDVPKGS